jgi:hypothetical protein
MGLLGMAWSYAAFGVLHLFQFVLAITVCGLYGVDLGRAAKAGVPADGKWVGSKIRGLTTYATRTYTDVI